MTRDPGQPYSAEVRRWAMVRYKTLGSARRAGREIGIHYQTLYRWAEQERREAEPMRWRCCSFLLDITRDCPVCAAKAPAVLT